MGRPKSVNIKTFPKYDKLHTSKTKMMCGVTMTTLYPIKETDQFYISVEVWAYCASKFKAKKKNVTLEVNIPIITDQKAIDFLEENHSTSYTAELKDKTSGDNYEAYQMLKKIFPDKEIKNFMDIEGIISAYNHGTLKSFDSNGSVIPPNENNLNRQKNLVNKFFRFSDDPECVRLRNRWISETDKTKKTQYLSEYRDFERDHIFKENNLTDTFFNIGENVVCYPVAFTENTAEWSIEKYGKLVGYAHAGEIFFVTTNDSVYFTVTRHF